MSFPPQQSADTVTKSRKIPKSRVYCPNKQKTHKKRTLFPKASKKKSENALNKSTHTQSRRKSCSQFNLQDLITKTNAQGGRQGTHLRAREIESEDAPRTE